MSTATPVIPSRFPLVAPSTTSNPVVQTVFSEIERELGFGIVPNVFRAMASQPAVLRATWDLFRATILEGELPRTIKEMVGVVVSFANESEYALKVHMHSLGVQGIAESTLAALASGSADAPGLAPSTTALLRLAHKAAHEGSLAVDEADVEAVYAEGVTLEELAEVIAAINLFRLVNSFTDLARVPVDAI